MENNTATATKAKKVKTGYESTFHRDGTVTIWDVYQQTWKRGSKFSDQVLASLDATERERVIRHTA